MLYVPQVVKLYSVVAQTFIKHFKSSLDIGLTYDSALLGTKLVMRPDYYVFKSNNCVCFVHYEMSEIEGVKRF